MEPFRLLGPPSGGVFVPCLPRESIAALKKGQIVAAAVPVGGLEELDGVVETLGRFGISAGRESMSVLFFARCRFSEFKRPLTLFLTRESASSVRLLYLLFRHTAGRDKIPRVTENPDKADGRLLIGDQALRWRIRFEQHGQVEGMTEMVDLAVLWRRYYRLPFVFARWVVRKDASRKVRKSLYNWLEQFKVREKELVAAAAYPSARRLGMSEKMMHKYFRTLRRCLTESDLQGQNLFMEKIKALGKGPYFQSVTEMDTRRLAAACHGTSNSERSI